MKLHIRLCFGLLLAIGVLNAVQAFAQSEAEVAVENSKEATPEPATKQDAPADTVKTERKWFFTVAPYLLFPFLTGDVGIGSLDVNVSANPGDLLGALDWGFMLYLEATHPKWAIIADGIFTDFSKKATAPLSGRTVELDFKLFITQVTGLRRLASWVEVGIGGRLVYQGAGLTAPAVQVVPAVDESGSKIWFDPLVVTRLRIPFKSKWRMGVLADFGGFGLGSDYAWQVYPYAGYLFHKVFQLSVAFRALGMKYEDGSGDDYYLFDAVIFGPEVGLVFHI